jgi:hypothetical protein
VGRHWRSIGGIVCLELGNNRGIPGQVPDRSRAGRLRLADALQVAQPSRKREQPSLVGRAHLQLTQERLRELPDLFVIHGLHACGWSEPSLAASGPGKTFSRRPSGAFSGTGVSGTRIL